MNDAHECEITRGCRRPAYHRSAFVFNVAEGRRAWGCDACIAEIRRRHEPPAKRRSLRERVLYRWALLLALAGALAAAYAWVTR